MPLSRPDDDPVDPVDPTASGDHGRRGEAVPDGPAAGSDDTEADDGAEETTPAQGDLDDLDDLRAARARRTRRVTRGIAAVLVVGLLLPTGRWAFEEIRFRTSAASVAQTLEGEAAGADLADTVLLVRTAGCAPGSSTTGSAFVLSTDAGARLVTNRHVVQDARQIGLRSLDGERLLSVTDVRISDIADVAVLDVDDAEALPPALAAGVAPPSTGDLVRLIGFPAARPFTTDGEVVQLSPGRMLLDLEVTPGASGSPVISEQGRVVGQIHAVAQDGTGVATPVPRLLEAVDGSRPHEPC